MVSKQLAEGKRDTTLDGWRGVAILGVLFDHFVTPKVLNLGRFGVEMFFVLSGMLMADILFVKREPIWGFFVRRFARIYPAMGVFATTLFLASLVFPVTIPIPAVAYASAMTMTANYISVFWHRTNDYDHLWSLCVEQHTYVCLGLIAALSRWRNLDPVRMTAACAAVAILDGAISTWLLGWHYNAVYWRSDVRGGSILIGAVAFMLLHAWQPRKPWIPLVALTLGIALNINIVPDPIKYSVGTVLVAIAATTLSLAPVWFRKVFESRLLVATGVVSYSIYLWQEPFSEVDSWSAKLMLLPVGLATGVLSYNLVEQPARRWLNRLIGSPRYMSRRVSSVADPLPAVLSGSAITSKPGLGWDSLHSVPPYSGHANVVQPNLGIDSLQPEQIRSPSVVRRHS